MLCSVNGLHQLREVEWWHLHFQVTILFVLFLFKSNEEVFNYIDPGYGHVCKLCMYVCTYIYVCTYVHMYVCMYVCMVCLSILHFFLCHHSFIHCLIIMLFYRSVHWCCYFISIKCCSLCVWVRWRLAVYVLYIWLVNSKQLPLLYSLWHTSISPALYPSFLY